MAKAAALESVAFRQSSRVPLWQDQAWQKLWLATQEQARAWRSLALVPAGPGVPRETMMQIAVTLAHTGMTHLGGAIHVADGTDVGLADLREFSAEVGRCLQGRDLVLVALAPLVDSVTSLKLAQAADCALLCVVNGHMQVRPARKTIEEIGAAHFIGSVIFHAPVDGA
jgi:hypothetical protein